MPPFMAGTGKREVILRAAHKLFLRDGFSPTSMDAITREAGVSKATVYAHFESKEKLFEALVRLGSEAALGSFPQLARVGGDPREELLGFFEPFLQLLIGKGAYAWNRLVIAEANRHPENAKLFMSCTTERLTQYVEQYLSLLAKEGLFPEKDVTIAAEVFFSIAVLGPLHKILMGGPDAVDFRANLSFGINLLLNWAKK